MVTRVVGEVNGTTVIFNVDERGAWTAAVPTHVDGEWIVSLFAYDDAGNRSFLTKVLFAISGHSLKITMIDEGYKGELDDLSVSSELDSTSYAGTIEDRGYSGAVEDTGMSGEVDDTDGYAGTVENRGYTGSLVECENGHEDGGI